MNKIKRALLSVSNKDGIVELARGLHQLGIQLISTGGTAGRLKEAGLPVTGISELTKYPEMMDGRVKTLHPAVHGGILAVRANQKHMAELKEAGLSTIDLIVCNLYPFAETIARAGSTQAEALENIDIGGPTMIRSAAKNNQDVAVVVDPADYDLLLKKLRNSEQGLDSKFRLKLAAKAFAHTAQYDQLIHEYLAEPEQKGGAMPPIMLKRYQKKLELRYGENPHQRAAFYQENKRQEPSLITARQLHGKALSFNNINDANGALELIKEFTEQAAVAVIKHANPCGMAVSASIFKAFQKAYAGDPLSAFGGIVALNRRVEAELATAIAAEDKFVELVIAPGYSEAALAILKKRWKNVRLLETGELYIDQDDPGYEFKQVTGGVLVQERDIRAVSREELKVVTESEPTPEQIDELLFAWKVVKHVKSNAIVMAKDGMVVGVGAGQMSRVDSMLIAGRKAGGRQEGGVVASDAFFPFPDAITEAAARGIKAVIQPGGSVRDQEVIQACNQWGIAMVFTGVRHFKH